jgi:hypothetical protein
MNCKPPDERPVRAEPSIAGKAPVRLPEVKDVRAEPSIAGRAPVRLPEVKDVRPEPSPVLVSNSPVATGNVSVWLALLFGEARV